MVNPPLKFPCVKYSQEGKCLSQEKCAIYRAGFCEVFGKVIQREVKKLPGRKIFLSPDKVEVLCQNVFIEVSGSISNLRERSIAGFVAFVSKIFYNCTNDLLKKQIKQEKIEVFFGELVSEDEEVEWELSFYVWKERINVEEEVIKRELVQKLYEFLEETPHPCGELLLYYLDAERRGLKQKEMAEELGFKENTFNQKIKRCKEWLRKEFAEKMGH